MEMELVYITKKIPLDYNRENHFIYKVIDIKEGYIEDDIFIDSNDKAYFNIKEPMFNFSEEELGFYKSPNLNSKVSDLDDYEDRALAFFDYCDNLLLYGKPDEYEDEFEIFELDTNKITKKEFSIVFDETRDNDFFYVPTKDFIDLVSSKDIDLIEEFCDELIKKKEEYEAYANYEPEISFKLDHDIIDQYIENEEKEKEEEVKKEVVLSPREKVLKLKKELDKRIIGQDLAKSTICYAIYKNLRLQDNEKRTHILLVGPTGSGKSEIINTINDVLGVPIVHVDANSNSATGYVGDSITNNLASLYFEANGDLDKAQHGILAFDEIDKKGSEKESDVGGRAALNQILRMCDGQKYRVPLGKDGMSREIEFDTSNLTILACGAFPKVYESVEGKKSTLGFLSDDKKDTNVEITPEKIADIGNMGREFVGRFVLAHLNRLTIDQLKEIMTKSSLSQLKKQIDILEAEGIHFEYDDKFLDKTARDAYKEGSGGRGIKNTLDRLFVDIVNDQILSDDFEEDLSLFGTAENDKIVIKKLEKDKEEEKETSKVKKLK